MTHGSIRHFIYQPWKSGGRNVGSELIAQTKLLFFNTCLQYNFNSRAPNSSGMLISHKATISERILHTEARALVLLPMSSTCSPRPIHGSGSTEAQRESVTLSQELRMKTGKLLCSEQLKSNVPLGCDFFLESWKLIFFSFLRAGWPTHVEFLEMGLCYLSQLLPFCLSLMEFLFVVLNLE